MSGHNRKCHDCGNVATHFSDVTPGVLCPKCGSQDTRRLRDRPSDQRASSDKELNRLALMTLPLSFEDVAQIYFKSPTVETQKLCESHERLRKEVSGYEIVVAALENEADQLKERIYGLETVHAERTAKILELEMKLKASASEKSENL